MAMIAGGRAPCSKTARAGCRAPSAARPAPALASRARLARRGSACRAQPPVIEGARQKFDTRPEHNKAQAAVFDRPEIVRQFTAPQPPAIEARLAAIAGAVPGLGPDSRVIDAGCGTGCLIPHLQARGVADITAVDLSEAMLAELRARFPSPGGCGNDKGVRTWQCDFVDLPVYTGSADAIFLNAMFGNVHDQHYSLARAAQLLKPGGYAVISHQEGRAWHSALRASSGPGLIPHELPGKEALEELLFDSPFELVDLRDEEGLYLALLRIPPGFVLPEPVRLAGTVVPGFGRGSRDLAVPTANIDPAPLERRLASLARGVYFGWAQLDPPAGSPEEDGAVHKMVMNIGRRPTVNTGDEAATVEVHILHDYVAQDFHGAHLRVVATSFLRPEMKFDSLAALQKRIKADIGIARSQLDSPELGAAAGDASFERRA
ncbi:riboflavin kinase [Raphidocelis subcapitata]|uniref:riboflavin kinase n=1 Tax=Raphidocelis subcapitata TaxID=307507 RepID=A0A2V0PA07_9CHLO|nr:riboflavin kinase [Raphidocelis subcapitata]|eukprot:GBF93935.1 riboflavin kinase [Raphidocelis subcapitata]